jgi:sec-independent protein translocase protein TatA
MINLFIICGQLGVWEIILIVAFILLLFGGKKIPELMKGLGSGIFEFKKAMKEGKEEAEKKTEDQVKQ